jgi:hypothetical protein
MGRFITSCLRLVGVLFFVEGSACWPIVVQNVQNVVSECYLGSGEAVLAPGKRGAASNIIPQAVPIFHLRQYSCCANLPMAQSRSSCSVNTAAFIIVHQTAIMDRRGDSEDVVGVKNACWSLSGIVNS